MKEKKAESIAEFEQKKKVESGKTKEQGSSKKKSADKSATKSQELSFEERKQLDRDIRKLKNKVERTEKEIEETEGNIELMNKELAELDYSDAESAQKKLEEYEGLKSHLDWLVNEWEKAESALSELKNN